MVITVTPLPTTPKHCSLQNQKRKTLLPSDSDNASPHGREVTSRDFSVRTSASSSSSSDCSSSTITSGGSNSSRRSQSSEVNSRDVISTPTSQNRTVSTERRSEATMTSTSGRMLVKSVRSLLVSFQGESYSLPVNTVKPPPATVGTPIGLRKSTLERRKEGVTKEKDRASSRWSDQKQHRWPGRLRAGNSSFKSQSTNFSAVIDQSNGSSSALKEFRRLKSDENSRNDIGANSSFRYDFVDVEGISEIEPSSRQGGDCLKNSVVKRIPTKTTAGEDTTQLRRRSRGVVTPVRFREGASRREHKVLDPNSSLSNTTSSRTIGPSKLICATVRTASPSRTLISSTSNLLGGVASPSDSSSIGILMNGNYTLSPLSEYSFAVDIRRKKLREPEIANVHSLRLLYNRLLQWQLANAKVENALLVQTDTAEKSLCNAWIATAKLRCSYESKRIELQSLRSSLKLYSILKEHEPHLKCWGNLDSDHCNSISSAINALEASVIRLPIVGGAKADLREVQEAISSAVDITQAMTSPIFMFLAKVKQMQLLVSELSDLSVQEHHLLDDCKDLFSATLVPLQAMQCSATAHLLQAQQEHPSLEKKL